MDGVQLSQGYSAAMRRQFTFKTPGISGTHSRFYPADFSTHQFFKD